MATMIPERRPEWLRVRPPKGENYQNLKQLMLCLLFATEDMREGMQAFIEKRKAEFQGR